MEQLASLKGVYVEQKKEWGEILTGFETINRYAVMDESGQELYFAIEVPGNGFARFFLKALRPFTLKVMDINKSVVIRVERPFRFYFHEMQIFDGQGNLLGTIHRKFSMMRRIYSVRTSGGQEYQLFGPILHPWTFEILKDGMPQGKIVKKWSGLLKEGFTDADNFGVDFFPEWDVRIKALFLGVVFLIDFVHFENNGKN